MATFELHTLDGEALAQSQQAAVSEIAAFTVDDTAVHEMGLAEAAGMPAEKLAGANIHVLSLSERVGERVVVLATDDGLILRQSGPEYRGPDGWYSAGVIEKMSPVVMSFSH